MAADHSRALAASTRSPRDYLDVYGHLLGQVEQPVILHWLGEDFDPALRGYWGAADFPAAADTVIELAERANGRIGGIWRTTARPSPRPPSFRPTPSSSSRAGCRPAAGTSPSPGA